MEPDRPLIYDLDLPALREWVQQQDQPAYRAGQVRHWLYQRCCLDWAEMTNLPGPLREALAGAFRLPGAQVVSRAAEEESAKLLVEYADGARVECVTMARDALPTFCLSTQVGCAMGCSFCASTLGGCDRNLSGGEMIAQAALLAAEVGRPGNVVFMGMGEPLLNLEAVAAAVARFTGPDGWGLSARRITLGTCGIVPQIRKLAELKLGVNLAVSLNATRDTQRRELMPGVARWPLTELLVACADYTAATGGQPVTFAYVVMRGVNDFPADADRLADLLRPLRHHLNLIPYNPVEHSLLQPPSEGQVRRFLQRLTDHGLNVSVRRSMGGGIHAACGQLRGRRVQRES